MTPTPLDNDRRSPRKLLRAVVARLLGADGVGRFTETTASLAGRKRKATLSDVDLFTCRRRTEAV